MSEKLSPEQLTQALDEAARRVVVGARYRHYKGSQYTVTGLALAEATQTVMVVYRAEYADRWTFVRPLDNWLETVAVDGRSVKRFARVDPDGEGVFGSDTPGK
ncbi:MAG TPA: DUF1653 domain-containing protein [Candidatus Saccharimonadia bacterium]|jgi:hypothetical protein|nr:DUF1653 domain-containing protein [Candidatus Saccharimonadia bacterium]